jgi:protein TonB
MTHSYLPYCLFLVLSSGAARAQQSLAVASVSLAEASTARAPLSTTKDSIYVNPEVLPVFKGGPEALGAYFKKNMHYPDQALRQHVGGRVFVSFVVSPEGKVQDVHVLRGIGAGLDDEASRLVWLMPAWTPGQHHGQMVRTACTMPIVFQP